MSGEKSETIQFDADQARSVEAMYQTPDVVGQRLHTIKALNLQLGEAVLDVGVGPGLLAAEMAQCVGQEGTVVGLDLSEDMVRMATTRCAALPQVQVRTGQAETLGVVPGSFDAVVSTQVLEYVHNVDAALKEFHAALRPGGRLVIVDTDWRSLVWHSEVPELMERVLACWDSHLVWTKES